MPRILPTIDGGAWSRGGALMDATLTIPFRTFRNALCLLRSFDMHELLAAGVISHRDEWDAYQNDEALFFLKLDDRKAAALWRMIQERMPEELRAADERVPA